jgi:hypothetical protein
MEKTVLRIIDINKCSEPKAKIPHKIMPSMEILVNIISN